MGYRRDGRRRRTSRLLVASVLTVSPVFHGCGKSSENMPIGNPKGSLYDDRALVDQRVPDQGVRDQGVRDQGAADKGTSATGAVARSGSATGAADKGVPDEGVADDGVRDQGAPDKAVTRLPEVAPPKPRPRPVISNPKGSLYDDGMLERRKDEDGADRIKPLQ